MDQEVISRELIQQILLSVSQDSSYHNQILSISLTIKRKKNKQEFSSRNLVCDIKFKRQKWPEKPSFAVDAVLTKLVSTVAEEVNLAWGLKGDLKTLGGKLNIILDLLKDAGRQQQKGPSMESWLLRLKNAAHDAEDVLDVFAFEMLRHKLEIQNRMKNKARNFFSLSNPILFRIKMTHKVREVNLMLARVVKEGKDLGLNQALHQVLPSISREIPQTHPFADDSNILGRETDTTKVVDTLIQSRSDENLSVISVVGLAGLGKTTLAQLVFKDQSVTTHFNHTLWVSVSNDFNVTRILKEMAGYLHINVGEISNIGVLTEKLGEKLKGNKYLLVLDDVWNTDVVKWECLRDSLSGTGAAESKILVTTRNVTVASTMESRLTHHLSVLSNKDSWSIFRRRAFATGGPNETRYLVDVGQRMTKRCGGVPLALKMLGAMMHSKEEHEWSSIEESTLWDAEGGIMSALRLSFNNLPSPCLKQCFAYCSVFPKDFKFDKDDLIQLWIAQGFIPPSEGSNTVMEDTGNEYFKILWWNSFFQDVERNEYGKIKTAKMHGLVHDLAQSLTKSECLVLDANNQKDNIEVRHLALARNVGIIPIIPKEIAMKLRTFFSAGDRGGDILMNSKFLHALKLVGQDILELPATIGKLKQLRYLDVSQTDIKVFSAFIAKLYNLQTLRLPYLNQSIELLEQLNTLIRLRHLYFDSKRSPLMPIALGRLTCLQTLSCFVVGMDKGRRIEELGPLRNLRGEIDIRDLQYVSSKEEAKKANLAGKTKIYKLKLAWEWKREGDNNDEDVLEGLQPPPNLNSLTIEDFYGSKFPSWMMIANTSYNGNSLLPLSLVKITLFNCKNCERIPTLGELPFLKYLEISNLFNVKCIGMEFYSYSNIDCGARSDNNSSGDGNKRRTFFPALQELTLRGMCSLVEWTEVAAATIEGAVVVYPCLKKSYINECEQLLIAPSHFPFLQKLWIVGTKSGLPIANIISKVSTLTHIYIEDVSEPIDLLLQNNKNLISVEIRNCEMLRFFSILQSLTSLQKLSVVSCDGITSLPVEFGSCTSLEELEVKNCPNLKSIAEEEEEEDLSKLNSLSSLVIYKCPELKMFLLERFIRCLPRLKRLHLDLGSFSEQLYAFPFNLNVDYMQILPQIEYLVLYGGPNFKYLPYQLQHLTTLENLFIYEFEGLEVLPDWLGSLSSLNLLSISACCKLKYLPSVESMRRLTNLRFLSFDDCPLLEERLNEERSRPEGSKISLIPKIWTNHQRIQ